MDKHSTAMACTNVEEHIVGAIVLEVVAVDAVIVFVVVFGIVFVDYLLIKVCDVTLIDTQLAIEFVAGFNQTIGEVGVNLFLCYVNGIFRMLYPSAFCFSIDIHFELFAFARSQ